MKTIIFAFILGLIFTLTCCVNSETIKSEEFSGPDQKTWKLDLPDSNEDLTLSEKTEGSNSMRGITFAKDGKFRADYAGKSIEGIWKFESQNNLLTFVLSSDSSLKYDVLHLDNDIMELQMDSEEKIRFKVNR